MGNGTTYITRIPLGNFTIDYIKDISLLTLPGIPTLEVATTDGVYIYFGANTAHVFRMNINMFTVDPTSLLLTGVSSAFAGAFADPERMFVYFFTTNTRFPSTLVRVCSLVLFMQF